MSTFRVKLTNPSQGVLDTAGQAAGTSYQRTVYVMGPNKTNRKLNDGDEFEDVNYWKRFAYPQLPLDQAFIEVVEDDGSPYDDTDGAGNAPYTYSLSIGAGDTYDDDGMSADILSDTGSYASYCQVTATVDCLMKINDNDNAIIPLNADTTQIFNPGDLRISSLSFDNSASGASNGTVSILVGYRPVASS